MRHLAAVLLAAASAFALPAAAQETTAAPDAAATDIAAEPAAGYVVQGSFALDGAQGYWLTLAAGRAVEVTALPLGDVDPVLTVFDESGRQIAENDDYGDGLAARVPLHSAAGQRVRVVVSQLGADENGGTEGIGNPPHFTLIVAPATWQPTEPQLAGTLPYTFSETLPVGSRQAFVFEAEAGQTFEATLRATEEAGDLDPYLRIVALAEGQSPDLVAAMGDEAEPLAEDDDSGGNLDAQLVFTAPAAGRYAAIASDLGDGGGAYRFDLAAFIRPEPITIELDRATAGVLASRTAPPVYRLSDRAIATLARQPGPLTITLDKVGEGEDALDPMLEVGIETPFGPSVIASDDDSGGDLNARLVLPVVAGQDITRWLRALRITATAVGSVDSPGAFELTVTRDN